MSDAAENKFFHTPVLLNEVLEYLFNDKLEKQIIVDGTLGGGGYSEAILKRLNENDLLIALDKDLEALEHSKKRLEKFGSKVKFFNNNFADIKTVLLQNGMKKITGLVLDLGLSSHQIENEDGFSYLKDTKLDMRAFKKDAKTAGDVLNSYSKEELMKMFEDYGETGNERRLADAIIEKRKVNKFKTTFDVVRLIEDEYRIDKKNMIKFLSKIFQALRIEVNNEMDNLKKVLNDSIDMVEEGGRIVMVSYHSLEDRIVKNFFKEMSATTKKTDNPFYDETVTPKIKILTKKSVVPAFEEIKNNSRARSAKLRCAERM
ncbi:MAG: 16S rRNA (cytosine(1402)-N(4))-methyltransferase RsmH [Bacteroidetes bacterium]|nr:16S rRNA (cytosine(1402)-N(4))-methyltransferase RsmH [Bacteroidota bacterium]